MLKTSRKFPKSFKKGDVLLSEEPFAFVLKSSLRLERCDHCFKRTELKKCSGCSFVHYCNRNCQKAGWSFHKYECSNMKRVFPLVLPDAARMLARIIMKLHNGGAHEKSYYTDTKFRVFRDLMSHYNEIKNDEKRVEHFISLNEVLHDFMGDQFVPNGAELLAIYGKMVVNTFNILDYEMQGIGTGMYLAASVVDHSCSPNAVAVFDGTKLYIRALQDIESLDWTKIFISYIEVLNLPSERQKELETLYYFLCQCKRCLDVEDLNLMTSTICQNSECKKRIPRGTLETTTSCPNCNEDVSEETREQIREVVKFTEEQISKMNHLAYIDMCRLCLKKQEGLFHDFNIYKVKIINLAMDGCINIENWEAALDYGRQVLEPMRKYYGEVHPITGIFLMSLGKLAKLQGETKEATNYFKESLSILTATHGRDHPLIKEELLQCVRDLR